MLPWPLVGVAVTLLIRFIQRIYYLLCNHRNYSWQYSPREDLMTFLREKTVVSEHQVISSVDNVPLRCLKVGKGDNILILTNGVGTDFFMWLPTIRFIFSYLPDIFNRFTLLVPSYRGLFQSDEVLKATPVVITIERCVEDIQDVMKYFKLSHFDAIIGWSTGAQVAIAYNLKYPSTCKGLFLLNPSAGLTLHYALQPCIPLPAFLRNVVSQVIKSGIRLLLPLIATSAWVTLQAVTYSSFFRIVLECLAFFGGFPPEQPTFFHEYMRDVFRYRAHTRGLLNLILSLDAEEPSFLSGSTSNIPPPKTMIVDCYFDFITGVYLGERLAKKMPNSRRVTFSMGSHFLLLEWPDLLAKEIVTFIS